MNAPQARRAAPALRRFALGALGALVALVAIGGPPVQVAPAQTVRPPRDVARPPLPAERLRALEPAPRVLTVVAANFANSFKVDGLIWQDRVDRFASLVQGTGQPPDLISLTEWSGWTSCVFPARDNAGDYDLADRLLMRLETAFGVRYRIAYLVGVESAFANRRCRFYTGDMLLYHPGRLVNMTPDDAARHVTAEYDDGLVGFQLRRSLPPCNTSTRFVPVAQLLDGPPRVRKCNQATPSAPAWTQVVRMLGGDSGAVATLARFAWAGTTSPTFDIATVHPTNEQEWVQASTIDEFLRGVAAPPFRREPPLYPLLVVGDYNALLGQPWSTVTAQVAHTPNDVMAASLGNARATLAPLRALRLASSSTLPTTAPCRPNPASFFSDHCALVVRFTE